MKPGIHPEYRPVVFRDRAADHAFLTFPHCLKGMGGAPITATGDKVVEWEDGNTYPVIDVEISSASHPFSTGTQWVLDTAGRVERCERRYGRRER
ncbi:type B 50S ribosomal protein L31 [Streptomyces sp. TM32]|uniref:type B 50S ribosomal protein L31 n=1 Tax=Streptomyces sp. TM32 TaxID=1652669 RepID=UPI00101327F9|nr:type B 50S ribosomal protein L31 [Streptomyces sp. TM32]RXS87858.1 type B 50S ribosomal protein L31 [Streptomyces sp. TM32]